MANNRTPIFIRIDGTIQEIWNCIKLNLNSLKSWCWCIQAADIRSLTFALIEKFTFHLRIMLPFGSAFASAAKQFAFQSKRRFFRFQLFFHLSLKLDFDDTEVFEEFVVTFVRLRYLQDKLCAQWQRNVWKLYRCVCIRFEKIARDLFALVNYYQDYQE